MTTTNFPEKIVDREKYIYDQVVAGNFQASWVPLEYEALNMKVKLNVMADALKIDGVRVNVSATLQQKLADIFQASLLTAQVADLMYIHATHAIQPSPVPISSTVQSMVDHSHRVDVMVGQYMGGIVAPAGKHWILDKKLDYTPDRACNYGWHFLGTVFKGIKGYPANCFIKQISGLPISVIQPNATAHDRYHTDYSQICQLVSQTCWVDGQEKKFSDLLKDPKLCGLVTNLGVIKNVRQPGVDPVQGLQVSFPSA